MSKKKNHHSKLVYDSLPKKQEENTRKTGIDIIGSVPWGTHLCQFYKTKDDLIDILVPYFKTGLQNNEFCMWITSEPLHAYEAKRVLKKSVKNLDDYIKKGQIEILESTEWYTKSGAFDADEVLSGWVKKEADAQKKGFDGLRLTGNTFWLEKKDWEDFTKYEEVINHVIGNYKMIAICSYSLDKCNASEIIDVVSNHEFALIKREGTWHRIENPKLKTVEEKLKEKGKEQQIILDSVPALIFYKDKENRFIRTNKAFENAMGISKEMLEGKSCFDIYPKKQAEKYWNDDKQVIKTHKAKYGIVESMDTPNGTMVAQTDKIPYFDESGNIAGVIGFSIDITERKRTETELQRIEWLLAKRIKSKTQRDGQRKIISSQPYGDLTKINRSRLIRDSVGKDLLFDIVEDYLDLLDTSAAVYEKNGDYALGIFTSSWCQFMDLASHHLCDTSDNSKALASGKWLCHESCWTKASKNSIKTGQPTDIACEGGIHIYAVPIRTCKEIVGSINFGYGDPPRSTDKLNELAAKYNVNVEELRQYAEAYQTRPPYIIEQAKVRLESSARLIGEIIKRKQTEEALKKSENRLNRAQELSHLGSWELNLINNHLSWSDEVYRIFGLRPHEFDATYKAFLRFVHPDDRASVDAAYSESLREGRDTYEIEHRIVRKNGEVYFVHEKCEHIRDKSGKIIQSIGMVHDITERKQAEAELIRLASFPAKNPSPILEIDLSGKVQYCNPKSKQLFPDLEKKGSNHQFLKGIKNLIPEMQNQNKTPVVKEVNINDKYYLQAITYIPENQRIRIYSTDITERKQAEEILQESEEKYRRIVENTTNVIMVTQPDGIISYLSPSCNEVLGYLPEELVGKNPAIFHPDDTKKVQQSLSKALKGEKGSNFEYRIITKHGKIKWILHSWSPIFVKKKLHLIISVIEDITDRKEIENNIKELNKNLIHQAIELEAANKELEAFSYSVSHDLRAPLRSIDGFSQAILEDYANKLDEQGKDYIQRVRNATQKMGQLIDDMLRLSRLSRAELHYEQVDLSYSVRIILDKLQVTEPSRKVKAIIQDKLIVKADKKLLDILLENLLGNAWKFTGNNKHPTIEFGLMKKEKETIFFVRDNGAGFDMAYADKLFIPFQRLHSVDEFPGTGIGLAIVSRIIHRHGGRIWAEGEIGKGATFYFTLNK